MTHTSDRSQNTNNSFATSQGAQVEIYTSPFCDFCLRAKALLDQKCVDYEESVVLTNPALRAEMLKRTRGRTSVPQIFINGEHIGGSDELYLLDQANELDARLERHVY